MLHPEAPRDEATQTLPHTARKRNPRTNRRHTAANQGQAEPYILPTENPLTCSLRMSKMGIGVSDGFRITLGPCGTPHQRMDTGNSHGAGRAKLGHLLAIPQPSRNPCRYVDPSARSQVSLQIASGKLGSQIASALAVARPLARGGGWGRQGNIFRERYLVDLAHEIARARRQRSEVFTHGFTERGLSPSVPLRRRSGPFSPSFRPR